MVNGNAKIFVCESGKVLNYWTKWNK